VVEFAIGSGFEPHDTEALRRRLAAMRVTAIGKLTTGVEWRGQL
jgi:hypothetical protein